jgi:hypothetical protein
MFSNWEYIKEAKSVALWDNLTDKGNSSNISVNLPVSWVPFFISMLSYVDKFGWAKDFLLSGAPALLDDNNGTVTLPIPKDCPINITNPSFLCITEIENATSEKIDEGEGFTMDTTKENTVLSKTDLSPDREKQSENKTGNTDLSVSGGNGKKRRTTTKPVPVEDSQVRRSDRVKNGSNGFKASGCPKVNCISCNPNPPILPPKVIRNLGVQFCGLDPDDLSVEKLTQKAAKMDPTIRKKAKKGGGRADNTGDKGASGAGADKD